MPIALDYRLDRNRPRALYFGQSGWVEVAPGIDDLIERLGVLPGQE